MSENILTGKLQVVEFLAKVEKVSKRLHSSEEKLEFHPNVYDAPVVIGDRTLMTTELNQACFNVARNLFADSIEEYKDQVQFGSFKEVRDVIAEVFEYATKTREPALRQMISAFFMSEAKAVTNRDTLSDQDVVNHHIDSRQSLAALIAATTKDIKESGGSNTPSSVYFVLNTSRGILKIGYSVCVQARFSNFVTGTVDDLVLVGTIPGGRKQESDLHRKFASLRVRKDREWFYYSKTLKTYVEKNFGFEFDDLS